MSEPRIAIAMVIFFPLERPLDVLDAPEVGNEVSKEKVVSEDG
jgi:hypothetical protein